MLMMSPLVAYKKEGDFAEDGCEASDSSFTTILLFSIS